MPNSLLLCKLKALYVNSMIALVQRKQATATQQPINVAIKHGRLRHCKYYYYYYYCQASRSREPAPQTEQIAVAACRGMINTDEQGTSILP